VSFSLDARIHLSKLGIGTVMERFPVDGDDSDGDTDRQVPTIRSTGGKTMGARDFRIALKTRHEIEYPDRRK
jgi:hypothetical protein